MDTASWNKLKPEQRDAIRSLSGRFIKAVQNSGTRDGFEFAEKYSVQQRGRQFIISDGESQLSDISHSDRAVMEGLMRDAAQNFGR